MSTHDTEYKRRIVCAANRSRSGEMILGARHWDVQMRKAYTMVRAYHEACLEKPPVFNEQGFIDQHGTFLTRQEAWKVAEAAGQIIRRCGNDDADGGTLYSENLY